TVPEVGKRQLNEINRIRYELELMAVALAVENLTMQKNVAMLCQQYSR
ncbi:GntR family transcriptional regulator, partial [Escherichia coli]|nr:GntR family transcriptional regulator [Escherichia coli]